MLSKNNDFMLLLVYNANKTQFSNKHLFMFDYNFVKLHNRDINLSCYDLFNLTDNQISIFFFFKKKRVKSHTQGVRLRKSTTTT